MPVVHQDDGIPMQQIQCHIPQTIHCLLASCVIEALTTADDASTGSVRLSITGPHLSVMPAWMRNEQRVGSSTVNNWPLVQ